MAGTGWIELKQTRTEKTQALRAEVFNCQREMVSWEINRQNRRQRREERSLSLTFLSSAFIDTSFLKWSWQQDES